MNIQIKPRGKPSIRITWPTLYETEPSASVVAQRAVELHDPRGTGRVQAGVFRFGYDGGRLR